ncbi:hypothetical protein M569_16270 [Genlisea aurea]|uniref:Uncharacterized protein n=1 Tax=Genlisea aurea TaxID=192259 RepID=S8BVZ9_9LAMI|nr:hypothetical protein M569_16270 [Genlisea aurea]
MVRERLNMLQNRFGSKPVVVITEKDYDRSPESLGYLKPFEALVLCSEMQFLGNSKDRFGRCVFDSLSESNKIRSYRYR